jgi:hypothetical protein
MQAFNVAQRNQEPLALWQLLERRTQILAQLVRDRAPLGVFPGAHGSDPASVACETVLDRQRFGLLALRRERRERDRAARAPRVFAPC